MSHLRSSINVIFGLNQIFIVLSVSRIVQLTSMFSICVRFSLEVDADAVMFLVTNPFAFMHIVYFITLYYMILQTFVSKGKRRLKRERTTRACTKRIVNESFASMSQRLGRRNTSEVGIVGFF